MRVISTQFGIRIACFSVIIAGVASSTALAAEADACKLLSTADVMKATGLTVGEGAAGAPIPGVLSRCTWTGSDNTKVIITLTDAAHMQTTIAAQESFGTAVSGLGTQAVGVKGSGFTGGGYIVSIIDGKGGTGVSILGKNGTPDRVVALAKIVES